MFWKHQQKTLCSHTAPRSGEQFSVSGLGKVRHLRDWMDITSDFHSWSEESPEHFHTLAAAGKPCRAALWLLRPTLGTQAWLRKFALLQWVPHCKKSGGTPSRPELRGDSKLTAPPSASACPTAGTTLALPAHIVLHNKNGEWNRGDLAGAFKSARNCQEEEKLSIWGLWVLC